MSFLLLINDELFFLINNTLIDLISYLMKGFFNFSICGRQEEPAILISRLLLRMRRMYVASIGLDFD